MRARPWDDLDADVDRVRFLAAAARSIGIEGLNYTDEHGGRCDAADQVMVLIEVIEAEATRISASFAKLREQAEGREASA